MGKYVFIKHKHHGGYDDNGSKIDHTTTIYYSHKSKSWQSHIFEGRTDHFLFDDNENPPNNEGVFKLFNEDEMITYYHPVEGQLIGYMDNQKHLVFN
jgi:hypothetical protein